jgi:hypothetical protein
MRIPSSPELDRCIACAAGTYSLAPAYIDKLTLASPSASACLACPFGSTCQGTNAVPRSGHWWFADMLCPPQACQVQASGTSKCEVPKCFELHNASIGTDGGDRHALRRQSALDHPRDASLLCGDNCTVRSIIMKCPIGACLQGGSCNQSVTEDSNCCAEGRTGPLCAVCLPGRTLIQNQCRTCVKSTLTVSSIFLGLGLAVLWYILAWRPIFESSAYKLHPLHAMLYVPLRIYSLYRWIRVRLVKKDRGAAHTDTNRKRMASKDLQNWFFRMYILAKDGGIMPYTKVCVCVCVCVCMHVCMHVCMYSVAYAWMEFKMVCTNVCMHVCMCICMYPCVNVVDGSISSKWPLLQLAK